MSHYDYLNANFEKFTQNLGIKESQNGLISAHGDKCYGYKLKWEVAGVPFEHGVAIYLLTYIRPYSQHVRDTKHGWVDASQWVIDKYEEFKIFLPPIS